MCRSTTTEPAEIIPELSLFSRHEMALCGTISKGEQHRIAIITGDLGGHSKSAAKIGPDIGSAVRKMTYAIMKSRLVRESTNWPPSNTGVKDCSRTSGGAFGGTGRMETISNRGPTRLLRCDCADHQKSRKSDTLPRTKHDLNDSRQSDH